MSAPTPSLNLGTLNAESGWGNFPTITAQRLQPHSLDALSSSLQAAQNAQPMRPIIARGMGRSYGDSSLAPCILDTQSLNHYQSFDAQSGILACQAGVTFDEILSRFVPQGWFLPVTPGTKFITVGGAIASDVHGKNHHLEGSFSDHLLSLTVCLASGEHLECSPQQHRELFLATCGGMGLTGVIVAARFAMRRISSAYITQTTFKTANLSDTLALFDAHQHATYSVAWIDCLASGAQLGRSLLMLGEHADQDADQQVLPHSNRTQNALLAHKAGALSVPFYAPGFALNPFSVKLFNQLYYHKTRGAHSQDTVHYQPFFYPLDGIKQWNKLYGKAGFCQYQFVIPHAAGLEALTLILTKIAHSKRGSFLAVLKAFGAGNANYLSFPMRGYTLALDFKMDATLLSFLTELDRMVLDFGGRIYLTKDARMSEQTFKQSYPNWHDFQNVRAHYGALDAFQSLQSQRLGL
ncbi:FAD-binding oxidoreductase [Thiomicrorhabdus aquaedulcis]|uniref:FAD-binding oxidoreductase n=1 Tax=Thiomicrorhabdus aquaedulcis TaxID=2211106 RepID=UPI000FD8284B|nr:FAD-binding oxidoreductase [Thiomicrorhabdus aquaedulcis]